MTDCKFCKRINKNLRSKAAHERFCKLNPEKSEYHIKAWNKGLTSSTDDRVLKNTIAMKKSIENNGGSFISPEGEIIRKKKLSDHAKLTGFGGYRAGAGRSKKFKVIDSFGKETTLQSSYELAIFNILSDLKVRWVRPGALKYDNRNYFSDFYLVDFDIYLDPKNSYKAKLDVEKIEKVRVQNNVKIYVLLKHQLTKEEILSLCV